MQIRTSINATRQPASSRRVGCRAIQPGSAAFTIVEAITSTVIVGLMVFSLWSGISFCFASTRVARENLRATQILLEKIEVIRLCTWEQVNSNGFLPDRFTTPYDPTGPTNNASVTYKGKIVVRPPPAGFLPDQYTNSIRLVDVQLEWQSGDATRKRDAHTFVSRYGLQNYILHPK